MMMILSRVCAEFHDAKGNKVFTVTPAIRNCFVEAPDSIREDPLFRMLINDGSLEAAVPEERRKLLEQDPTAGHDASGKLIPTETEEAKAEAKATRSARSRKTAKAEKAENAEEAEQPAENVTEPAVQA